MPETKFRLKVGLATCGIADGAAKVYSALQELLPATGAVLERTGCMGMCYNEPLVELIDERGRSFLYAGVTPGTASRIVEEHIKKGEPVKELLVKGEGADAGDGLFLAKQHRIILKNCGSIDPENIDSYLAAGGYKGFKKALTTMTPEDVINEVKNSGLRGRGGAGFPTSKKWSFTREARGKEKYIVCNADEGDPGAFMDRSILEGDTHSVLEGMLIAGYAIGAGTGYIYIRAEYPLAISRLKIAIKEALERGFLGEKILGSDFSFQIFIREGAGAFVCGEETALLASIEGKRGMPRFRPPFPAQKGLFGCPTSINNVETFANVPWILHRGASSYRSLGTEGSKGTKVFALAGKVKRGGLIEIPMGTTIREIVFDVGGGISTGKPFKAVQIGGPSGGCIPEEHIGLPIDFDSLTDAGAMMGSGGLIVVDEETCMVDLARYFLNFTRKESCGQCIPCRLGVTQMHDILEDITAGRANPEDIELLEELAHAVKEGSMCGLGQTAPNPVLTTLRYFRHEYEAHVKEKRCPALVCKDLIEYRIDAGKCNGCRLCVKVCAAGAISGEKKEAHFIDNEICNRCGACIEACPGKVSAIYCVSEGINRDKEQDSFCKEGRTCQS